MMVRYSCLHTGRTLGTRLCDFIITADQMCKEAAGKGVEPDAEVIRLRELMCEQTSGTEYEERDRLCRACIRKERGTEYVDYDYDE